MAWGIVLFALGVGAGVVGARIRRVRKGVAALNDDGSAEVGESVAQLKNALLTLALGRLRADDLAEGSDASMSYASYDGGKLPPLSGFDLPHACMTYIADIPSGSLLADQRTRAVLRYLERHLGTREQAREFFDQFAQDYSGRFKQPFISGVGASAGPHPRAKA